MFQPLCQALSIQRWIMLMEDPTQFYLLTECNDNSEEGDIISDWLLQENAGEKGLKSKLCLFYNIWLSFSHIYKTENFPWEQRRNKNRKINQNKICTDHASRKTVSSISMEMLDNWNMTQLMNDLGQSAAYLQYSAQSPCA